MAVAAQISRWLQNCDHKVWGFGCYSFFDERLGIWETTSDSTLLLPPTLREGRIKVTKEKKIAFINTVKATVQEITPDIARQYLDNNTENRNIMTRTVKKYAAAIQRGEWLLNNHGIAFDTKGRLLDGQHRLLAVIEANMPITALVVEGLVPDVMKTIDIGQNRRLSDLLALEGAPSAFLLAATLRLVMSYRSFSRERWAESTRTNSFSFSELIDFYQQNQSISDSVRFSGRLNHASKINIVHPASIACMHFILSEENKEKIESFFEHLITGANLNDDHPVLTLRQHLLEKKLEKIPFIREEVLGTIIKAWNAWIAGKRISSSGIAWGIANRYKDQFPILNVGDNRQYKLIEG